MRSFLFDNRLLIAICTMAMLLIMVCPVQAVLKVDYTMTYGASTVHNVITDNEVGMDLDSDNNILVFSHKAFTSDCFEVKFSIASSKFLGLSTLNYNTGSITNVCGGTVRFTIAISDNDYPGPACTVSRSAAGNVQNGAGSDVTVRFYNDPNNVQGANTDEMGGVLTPGNDVGSHHEDITIIDNALDYHPPIAAVNDLGKYSMTMLYDLNITKNAQQTGFLMSMQKLCPTVPEFPTLAVPVMSLIGLAGIVLYFKTRKE